MIAQILSDTASHNWDGLAINERITYGALLDRIDGISRALREMLYPRPGDCHRRVTQQLVAVRSLFLCRIKAW